MVSTQKRRTIPEIRGCRPLLVRLKIARIHIDGNTVGAHSERESRLSRGWRLIIAAYRLMRQEATSPRSHFCAARTD
jgi:hypothetical protein